MIPLRDHIILTVILATGFLSGHCQVIDAATCDSSSRFPVTKYAYYLRTTEPISLDSVLKSQQGFIKASNEPVAVFNYDPYYYWFRFIVHNKQYNNRDLMLLMAPIGMYEGRLFQRVGGQWKPVAKAGLKYPFRDRSYQFTHHVFPFTLAPASTDTLYVSIDASNVYKSIGFAMIQPKELKIFENDIYFVFGIIVGLLLLFFVLNIALFFALKEKLHLWYSLYIVLLFLVVMKNDQLDQQFLGLDSEMAFRLTPYLAIGALAITVLMHVVQRFLKEVLIHHKPLYRVSVILKINVLCSAVVHAFVFLLVTDYRIQSIVFSWAKLSILIGICIIIINCLYCIRKGFKSALFIFFGSFVFMIGSVQRLFFPSTLSFLFPPTTFHIGIILETFIISMGLIYRYWSEKELQRKREEQIQVQTIHDISEEIHDNIGQTLTVANLNLKTINFNDEAAALHKLTEAKTFISQAIVDLRDLSRTLKNESVPGGDLIAQIRTECSNVEKAGIFTIEYKVQGELLVLENRKQSIIIRIIKEVLQNVIKHAQATIVVVELLFKPSELTIQIKDNGIGFDVSAANQGSNGLENIYNRCLLLNATCAIESRAGSGTTITIQMPL